MILNFLTSLFPAARLSSKVIETSTLFGPNIGYGGTEFEYDSGKNYFFRIAEFFGSAFIPLNLQ